MTTDEYKDALDYMAALRVLQLRGELLDDYGSVHKIPPVVRFVAWSAGLSFDDVMNDLEARADHIIAERVSSDLLQALVAPKAVRATKPDLGAAALP